MRYWMQLATEQFTPSDLVRQAVEAEQAGFERLCPSDHLQPWWEPGESGHAWVLLGALGEATERVALGTGVTAPVFRHNPVMVAQAFATVEEMNPGRAFVGIGSGESLNESPAGMDWPSVGEQIERMDEALGMIGRLLDGERLDHDGKYFRARRAFLHTRGERRPPIYVSAFGPQAAEVAARHGDGVWTLADPEQAPTVIDAYRGACDDLGKEAGEVILQAGFSWAEDDDAALEGGARLEGHPAAGVLHRRLARPAGDVPPRRGDGLGRGVQGELHRLLGSGGPRRPGTGDREARRDYRRPAERVRRGPARRHPRLRRERAARAALRIRAVFLRPGRVARRRLTKGDAMPPRGVKKGTKRARQYEHIKKSQKEEGRSDQRAEEIAARTVNKERARSGESRQRSRTSTQDISSGRRGGLRSGSGPGGRTRDQLYNDAKKLGIEGRSKMNKRQLQSAVAGKKS